MNEKNLISTLKTVFLFTITTLVIINTYVLATLVPVIGYHIMPDNQAAAEAWKIVSSVMEILVTIIIVLGVVYGSVKIVNFVDEKVRGSKK